MNRKVIFACVILGALATGGWQQIRLSQSRNALTRTRTDLAAAQERIATARERLSVIEAEIGSQKREQNRLTVELAKARQQHRKQFPESEWTTPPNFLPEWNPDSPFVWVNKEIAPQLQLSPFTESGELDPGVLQVLAVDNPASVKLNERLRQFYRPREELELATATHSDAHLPGATSEEGEKLTIIVRAEADQSDELKNEFASILREGLGEQRAGLVIDAGKPWIAAALANFGKEPKTISLVRLSDGRFGVSRRCGTDWESMTCPADVAQRVIPTHLLPLFDGLFKSASESAGVPR